MRLMRWEGRTGLVRCLLLVLAGTCPAWRAAPAHDWPQYRCDAARSGYTAEQLAPELHLAWQARSRHRPVPAWPRDDRMAFDRAWDLVVAHGLVIYGDSVDGRVIARDAATGDERWTFYTGAPVRFAPAVWQDQLYVASDDGYLYGLNAVDGQLRNRWRPGPSDGMILGNGRMVSRWPARGGPVVRDGVVYFAAGVWQSDGIYLLAIDAATGRILWQNDRAGRIYMPQPHGGAMADSGVSAQGYLVATPNQLLVPTGRAVPASFQRQDGQFQYYHLQANGHTGGSNTVVIGGRFYNGGSVFQLGDGALETKLGPGPVASWRDKIVHGTGRQVRLLNVVEKLVPDRKGVSQKSFSHDVVWTSPEIDASASIVVGGETLYAGGGSTVSALDAATGKQLWQSEVDGAAYGLAIANQALYVSTDAGTVYCFHSRPRTQPTVHEPPPAQTDVAARDAEAADEILRRTQVRAGFCLDVDGGDAGLALALANRTDLQIYVLVHSDAELVAARRRLLAAGMYGTRVMVHRAPSTGPLYGRYFADLVISSRSTRDGSAEWDERKLPPELRPYGGVACSGRTGAMRTLVRGELARAGSWTHQYADLGNTSCSTDEIVQGNLHALWFRDVDLEMPQRHGRGPAPLYHGGRMFVEGLDAVRAVDAYNGRNLWTFPLPGILKSYSADHLAGTAVTGSNLCVAGDHVYVHDKQRCYRLDAATGQQRGAFTTPAGTTSASERDREPGLWGFVACDGRRLFGSIVNPAHRVRYAYLRSDMSELWGESSSFFVLDSVTGKPAWEYRAEASIRNNAITIGRDLVFLVDRALAKEDVWDPQDLSRKLPAVKEVHHPAGNLIALEADTGTVRWRRDGEGFGTMLAYSAEHDVLLLCFQPTRFKLPSEVGGRLAAYQGTTGKPLWQKEGDYVTRPLINDRTIYAQGGAWDLLTGDERPFTLQRSYGCGQIAASKNLLVFRSATLGYLDLSRGSGVENYGGIRPGCWINALPAGGLVLVPDASAGCQCSYQNRSWMALAGDAESP